MRASTVLVMLTLAAAPAAAQSGMGSPGGAWPSGGGHHGRPPEGVQALEEQRAMPDLRNPLRLALDDSAALALTPEQAVRLRAASDSLEAENAPLLSQVRRTMGEDPSGGVAPAPDDSTRAVRMDALKSYFDRIRWNNDQAWKGARGILSRDQQHKVADLRRTEEHEHGERPHTPGGRRPTGPGGVPASSGGF